MIRGGMYRPGQVGAKMADIDVDYFDSDYAMGAAPGPRRAERLIHLAGAATSVALLVGAIWWGYQLAVRDVTGVPVMRAAEGAMRVAPADPGGDVAGHQGLSVNAVAAAGTAAPLPDQLFLAPGAQGLAEEDAAGLAPPTVALAPQGSIADMLPMVEASYSASTSLAATEIPSADQDAVAAALAEALGGAEIAPEETPILTSGKALRSLRPMARPAPLAQATVQDASLGVTATDPDTISAGTRLVQLGAFDDESAANLNWSRLAGRFPELMAGKSMVVQPALSGGRTFYRLRALGFADEDEARRFCSALLAENATCIPVTQR
jgi:hypothetical protein